MGGYAEFREVEDLSQIVTDLSPGRNKKGRKQDKKFAVLLHHVLTPQECDDLIRRSEGIGYEAALVNLGNGRQLKIEEYRKSDRCIIDDPDCAEMLHQRILARFEGNQRLQNLVLDWQLRGQQHAVGCNERLRVLRYGPGCYFKPHSDGCYVRGKEAGLSRKGETSRLTVLLYLNEGYKGGATSFINHAETVGYDVVPKTGSVLLFEHECYHEGAVLKQGRKYVVRTEIMYTNQGPGHEYSKGLCRE